LAKSGFLAILSFAFLWHAYGQQKGEDSSHSHVTRIAPGFSIVTELSEDQLYLGQQFSILYRLEASRPPLAVDVDPQQFSGFWSEFAPLSEGARPRSQMASGDSGHRYWLRQVIAYPLVEGALLLPPLQVKIKTSQSSSQSADDWDLVSASDSPTVHVVSPMPKNESTGLFPLIGIVDGKMSTVRRGEGIAVRLELWGSANLDLFQPTRWVRAQGSEPLSIQLSERENTVQTRDVGGKRTISLLQRRRWIIRSRWNVSEEPQVDDMHLAFFDLQKASWNTKLIEGIRSSAVGPSPRVEDKSPEPSQVQDIHTGGLLSLSGRQLLWMACFFVLILVIVAIRFLGRRRIS
jgi:hypothetical protein